MNASEIRYIEAQLRAEPRLPVLDDHYAEILREANRARAKAIAEMWHALSARIAEFTRYVRDLAGSSNHGRVRHQNY